MGVAVPYDKYLLLGRVNVGGMAEVFLAKTFGAVGFEKFVAIKRLLPSVMNNREFVDMFIDEAKISVQLTHANIAQIYELNEYDGQLYIAMEYVHGKELRALAIRSKKMERRLDQRQVAYMVARAAEGLDYAHQRKDPSGKPLGIVHRDISPQNILVSFDGEVKVIDFGIAKAQDRIVQTQVGVLKGKIAFMSPEQVSGAQIDQRSDLFSLGCVLYEMVTGQSAFKAENDFATFERIRNAVYTPPNKHGVEVDPVLDKIMQKALAKDRDQRYSRGAEFAQDLQRYLLQGDAINSEHISELMRELFTADFELEVSKLAEYRQMKPPKELIEKRQAAPRAETEKLIEDHTRMVMLPGAEKTKTDRVPFAQEVDVEEYETGRHVEERTISDRFLSNGRRVSDTISQAPPPAVSARPMPPEEDKVAVAQTTISEVAALPGKNRKRGLSDSQELVMELRTALQQLPTAEEAMPLTRKKVQTEPKVALADVRRYGNEPGWARNGADLPDIQDHQDEQDEEGFTLGEIVLIAGAALSAMAFVVGVYLYTMRP